MNLGNKVHASIYNLYIQHGIDLTSIRGLLEVKMGSSRGQVEDTQGVKDIEKETSLYPKEINKKNNSGEPIEKFEPAEIVEQKAPGPEISPAPKIPKLRYLEGDLSQLLSYADPAYRQAVYDALQHYEERFMMHVYMMGKPMPLQLFILTRYFHEKSMEVGKTSGGMLVKNFTFWLNNCANKIETEYYNGLRDEKWFLDELQKVNGMCTDPELLQKFSRYYLTPTEGGPPYFKTVANFNVSTFLQSWIEKENKKEKQKSNGAKKNGMYSSLPVGVDPAYLPGDATDEDRARHYGIDTTKD